MAGALGDGLRGDRGSGRVLRCGHGGHQMTPSPPSFLATLFAVMIKIVAMTPLTRPAAAATPQSPPAMPRKQTKVSRTDRKSTRLNSSHVAISYAVFRLKKKKNTQPPRLRNV